MISIHICKSQADLVAYHGDHLEQDASDYYSENQTTPASLFGKGQELLSLQNAPYSQSVFASLAANKHPVSQEPITPRRKEDARVAFDVVFSTPKSVSVLALVTNDPRIRAAEQKAVAAALKLIEQRSMTRVRKDGQQLDRPTGNLIGVTFPHSTSRENDPQIHTHAIIFNQTYDPVEKRFKALQPSEIYKSVALATEVYRTTLVAELHKLGYQTKPTPTGFEIQGVPAEVPDLFSKRRNAITKIAADIGQSNNPETYASIARQSRKAKESIPMETLRQQWKDQLTPEQFASLQSLKDHAHAPIREKQVTPKEAINWAKRHLFERLSVVSHDELATAALRHARGQFTYEAVQSSLTEAITRGEFLGSGSHLTTREALRDEQDLIALVEKDRGSFPAFHTSPNLRGKLTKEQREVVTQSLASQDRFSAIHGPAGTGKTTTLQEIVANVGPSTLLAPSGSAADVLRKDGFADATTLQRFLLSEVDQRKAARGVVILDEAGMVSVGQMLQLSRLATTHNFRVILVGDSKQHSSVERGDALRILETHSNLRTASLKTIFRQRDAQYKAAVTCLKDGKAVQGFDLFDRMGNVHEITGETASGRGAALATDFAKVIAKGQTALAVSPTWRESNAISSEIRTALRSKGILRGDDHSVEVLLPLHQTTAEREEVEASAPGNMLIFQRKSSLFSQGEKVTVLGERDGLFLVQRANKETISFDPKKNATAFQVYAPQSIAIAAGDTLLLRSNGKCQDGRKLVNGQLVRIKKIDGDTITLSDGRKLPGSYRNFIHGYCISSQASQGKTVDHVFLGIDSQSAHAAASLEGFYVASSRGRYSCKIYTDSREELRDAIQNSSARQSAMELLAQLDHPTPHHEYNTRLPIRRKSLPDHRKLAHPSRHHPLPRYTLTRHRADSVVACESQNSQRGGQEKGLVTEATSNTDLAGRGSPLGGVLRSQYREHGPRVG